MFERHIYNTEFFDFIKSLAKNLEIYELKENEIIAPVSNDITKEKKDNYIQILNLLTRFSYQILAHSSDTSV